MGQAIYKIGKPCSGCGAGRGARCQNKLCKCTMRGINYNYCGKRGNYDPMNCACKCESDLFTGNRCQNVKCPADDKFFCGKKDYEPSKCGQHKSYRLWCPYMCGF